MHYFKNRGHRNQPGYIKAVNRMYRGGLIISAAFCLIFGSVSYADESEENATGVIDLANPAADINSHNSAEAVGDIGSSLENENSVETAIDDLGPLEGTAGTGGGIQEEAKDLDAAVTEAGSGMTRATAKAAPTVSLAISGGMQSNRAVSTGTVSTGLGQGPASSNTPVASFALAGGQRTDTVSVGESPVASFAITGEMGQNSYDSNIEDEDEEEEKQSSNSVSNSDRGRAVVEFASRFLGRPYVFGGSSLTNGTDCSGFVKSVYANFGISLPHSSSALRGVGVNVGSLSNAKAGDIICYPGHVGIYAGDGKIINALNERKGIVYTNANYNRIVAIRRIL